MRFTSAAGVETSRQATTGRASPAVLHAVCRRKETPPGDCPVAQGATLLGQPVRVEINDDRHRATVIIAQAIQVPPTSLSRCRMRYAAPGDFLDESMPRNLAWIDDDR